ncbi:ZZ-type zinc finger-containing protein 3 isoform X1 [Microtus oregoni]|uniref:ZZ-type zinc finger-containing protein 3 isoform X1 n=1 Tax=Microtus oregoni TaxID=111838 RepID=UPI001BB17F3F|nr:ZZ-type zinc finger-containing protein 3 isoform X1 [Microtus oregoni]XP_041509508.1 ZZ-type zinc finger-containing protein 3 isoform X1 [Microtus oregoni]XP_041509514.1 ZZ-type zinc finger-containing protein 3 isoform X1 [Microtus oregoni]
MVGTCHSMAASRSTRVTRSTVGLNGLDESFCGRTLRNRSIAHPEEISSHSQVRSRSPKKRPELVPVQKGNASGRTCDVKQQSAREAWVSPRKRRLSSSEKDDLERQALESCERRQTEPAAPGLRNIKRYSRAEASNSSEEDSPVKPDKESVDQRTVVDHDAEFEGTKRACRCLILDDCEKREIKKVNVSEEGPLNAAVVEEITGYLTVNGVDDSDSAVINCDDCQPDGNTKQNSTGSYVLQEKSVAGNGDSETQSPVFFGSRKEDSCIEHLVPCTKSEVQIKSEDPKLVTSCLPVERRNQLTAEPAVGPVSEIQSSLRDSEEEVDVVGDSGVSREQCDENSRDLLDTDPESMPVSAEPEPSSTLDCASAQMTPLSEPQEHRYTLRTSPRRAAPTRGSPTKNTSPYRENGQFEESNLSPSETHTTVSDNVSQSPTNPVEISQSEKVLCCDSQNHGGEGLSKSPSEATMNVGPLPSAKESASQHPAEEEDDDPDVYYFESDHVALKHNKDYQRLLQTIAVLEAQRSQAVQDLESLGKHQREALKNPIGFVEKLQKKADIGLPYPQRVVQLPEIVWDQYTNSLGNFEREFKNRKRHTRRVKLVFDKVGLPTRPKSPLDAKKDGESLSYSVLPLSDGPEGSHNRPQMIRGRLCDDTKPETFNQLWTVEEQKKLEQLLLKYPPEEVESRRWQKIADELGNRTAKQVASRVQKYFIKLTKAGIPVPGRTPNLYIYSKKSSTSRRQHPLNKHLFKPSTFMTSHEPPVYMDEDDDRSCFHDHMNTPAEEASDEESIPIMYRSLPEYKELLQFKKLKKQKLQQMQAESGFVQHVGFKCDNCGAEPIQGVRWHCQDCPPEMSLDFCDSCSDCPHETDIHKDDHQLEPVYKSETFLDRDYCVSQGTSYSYLDPNYFPANR